MASPPHPLRNEHHASNLSHLFRSRLWAREQRERQEDQPQPQLEKIHGRTVRMICPDGSIDMDAEILLAASTNRFCFEDQHEEEPIVILLPGFFISEVKVMRNLLHLGQATVKGPEQHRELLELLNSLGLTLTGLHRVKDGPFKVPLPPLRHRRKRRIVDPVVDAKETTNENKEDKIEELEVIITDEKLQRTSDRRVGQDEAVSVSPDRSNRYTCSYDSCSAAFGRVRDFSRHMRDEHSVDKPFSCHLCHAAYVNKSSLLDHVASSHANVRLKCDECQREFGNRSLLKAHEREQHSHTDRTVRCDQCEFVSKGGIRNLRKHVRTRHSRERTKKYQCSHCSKMFFTKSSVDAHELTHTGEANFSCRLCSVTFRRAHHLKAHLKSGGHESRLAHQQTKFGGGGEQHILLEVVAAAAAEIEQQAAAAAAAANR